ncbi:hypothetical protein [Acidocella sp.]|uniref:hypothetical protein n=1 Tax=Acidocella sp. TaxID=50710 RepID=UPI003CFCF287
MYASASTWLFNAARAVATELAPTTLYRSIYLETLWHLSRLPTGQVIVKTHHLTPYLARFMEGNSARILISIRDPRDAVTSLMQHMGQNFPNALRQVERSACFCSRYAKRDKSFLFVYEANFTERPETFDLLAQAFDGVLSPAARQKLSLSSTRQAVEAQIARLESLPTSWRNPTNGDLVDTETQWHIHHGGRTGAQGRWRNFLSDDAVREIEQRLAGFMAEFGYPASATLRKE